MGAFQNVFIGSVAVVRSLINGSIRIGSSYVLSYIEETGDVSVTILDASGAAIDLTGLTLGVYFETREYVSVAAITSGITISGSSNNVVSFTIPSTVTEEVRELIFSIRLQAAPKTVIAGGVFDVQYLPITQA